MKPNTTPLREELKFSDITLSAFSFLAEEHSFRCIRVEQTLVRYESSKVFVNIYHGRLSYTIGVEVGCLPNLPSMDEVYYTLYEIISALDEDRLDILSPFQASTPEAVEKCVLKLAEIVRHYANSALDGNQDTYQRLRENRHIKFLKYQINQVKIRAEEAWLIKDYNRVVELYSSLTGNLSPAEAKKLDYAKKKLLVF